MALGILDTEYLAKGIKVYYRTSSGAGIPNLAGFLKMSGPTGLFILQRHRYHGTCTNTTLIFSHIGGKPGTGSKAELAQEYLSVT